MGVWSKILGTDKVVDGIYNGIDKAFLTDEERLDYHKQMLKAYEPFKLIQRVLATSVMVMFSLVMIIEVGLVIAGGWYPIAGETAEAINDLEIVSMISYSFMAVMSLYFSGGVLNSFKGK